MRDHDALPRELRHRRAQHAVAHAERLRRLAPGRQGLADAVDARADRRAEALEDLLGEPRRTRPVHRERKREPLLRSHFGR